ncbi:hypothetical protein [Meiothermus granaticius]|uniref:Uncharacterized protein n=1 Tax=Meiothermus granaticius NBRC 107808 TaxID=1227551 RepID=A0A399F865_9DEIN|nr:hypothetical protein [Meiothermus granaticius]RIH92310.1 hypothetical protein Mgrana_01741 [Meiothermus granaticius NBRC 107808]GEM88048.1 hypothetical protein MGR01S_26730 [Meiothermus granaticius NBRC 107808]
MSLGVLSEPGWLEQRLSQYTRTFVDEYGTFYAHLEGGMGGETVLLWAARAEAPALLTALPKAFKGRLVLGLDASPGYAGPFARALHWASPRYALIVGEGEGVVWGYPGGKQVGEAWVPWDNPKEAERLEVRPRPDFAYLETLAYAPWKAPEPMPGLLAQAPAPQSRFRVGAVGWEQGIPTYGLGLIGLEESLQALLASWRITV